MNQSDEQNGESEEVEELPFFTPDDLHYFSSVIDKQFSSGDEDSIEIKFNLTKRGVFAKTNHWTNLLKRKGYDTEFRYDWQHSGRVRAYAWARVFMPALKTPDIFFTIAVVGFKENDKYVSTLEYKLDCNRNKLSKEKIKLFDDYVEEFCPDSGRQKIRSKELKNLSWDILVDRTMTFMLRYAEDYKLLTGLVNEETNLPKKLARVCWNEKGWEAPSGHVGKSKTSATSFQKEKAYGHEEWFFDIEKQINGHHYAFLQAFNKGDHEGEAYEMHLNSIKDTGKAKEKYWIGRVKNLKVLTREEAKDILAIYKTRGWITERLNQLREFQIQQFNFDIIAEKEMFNVRYTVDSSNFIRYNPYQLINSFESEVGSKHYVLLDKKSGAIDKITSGIFQFVEGHNLETKKGSVTSNYSSKSFTKNLLHREIQENIYNQFIKQYVNTSIKVGTEQSTGFGTLIDLVVNDPENGYSFYEIKTGGSAVSCIREAMGQMLEYCYYPSNSNASKLVIIAPHPIDISIKLYMNHLRKVLGIEIYYQYYSVTSKSLESAIV